jgi:two-component system, NarL family, sensor kinase
VTTRSDDSTAGSAPRPAMPPRVDGAWVTLVDGTSAAGFAGPPLRMRRVFLQLVGAALVVLAVVAVGGSYASRNVAEREAVNDAAVMTDLLAESTVQPALEDALLTGSPEAYAKLDEVVRARVLGPSVVRVKIWKPDGTVLYSDEPRVVGSTFDLGDDERAVLATATTQAEVSDLSKPENRFESQDSKLLEVYRPVWTPNGSPLLFETYLPYDTVASRTGALWRGFAGITVTSLLLLLVLMLPIIWRLLDRVQAVQGQRVALLEHAVDASDAERRRIAATLHDGVVQELAAASFAVSGAAEKADADGQSDLARMLRSAAAAVRGTIGGLRSLLVDIYPPSLATSGLAAVLSDLATTARTRDIDVTLVLPQDGRTGLDEDGERLVYRVAQECLRNATKHAAATKVVMELARTGSDVVLTVTDDGRGFVAQEMLDHPPEGHFGVQVMSDLAARAGARLELASTPGEGTSWRLTVPRS